MEKHEKIPKKELKKMAEKLFNADYKSHEDFFSEFFFLAIEESYEDKSNGKTLLAKLLKRYSRRIRRVQKMAQRISELCSPHNRKRRTT